MTTESTENLDGASVVEATGVVDVVAENAKLKEQIQAAESKMAGMVDLSNCGYQFYIPAPPLTKTQLYGQACANDTITVKTWIEQWVGNIRKNRERVDFHTAGVMSLYGKEMYKPVLVVGSGPSLKRNGHLLKERGGIAMVAALHSFGYLEDMGCGADYYVNLDAGDITVPEMSQGGKRNEEEYWALTEKRTLITALHGNPELIKRWRGPVYWFATIIPDVRGQVEADQITGGFSQFFQCGGNTVGAALYFARAILGGGVIAFAGVDLAFGYDKKFHPFDSPYDKQFAGVIPVTNVYGHRVYTWQSYFNFKCWFESVALGGEGNNPQMFINCTEGGILGSYNDGNIIQITQMPLRQFLDTFNLPVHTPEVVKNRMLLF